MTTVTKGTFTACQSCGIPASSCGLYVDRETGVTWRTKPVCGACWIRMGMRMRVDGVKAKGGGR